MYVIKSVIALYEHLGQAVALQLWDLAKYFDRESLVDGMNELYKNGVQGKLYKLLYMMNKNTKISVRTAVGDSEQREIGEGWGQGTIEGALCSAVNLDNGIKDFFIDSEYEVTYGDIVLRPTLFRDDVSRICLDPVSAQMGNDRMEAMAETKLLDFNREKSCYIIIGNKKSKFILQKEFELQPLTLYGTEMKQVQTEKYLGDQISSRGLADSVHVTISKRRGKVLQSIFEIRAVLDDCRSHVTGGMITGLDIWEMAVLPFLLNNCESWLSIPATAIKELDKLQNLFYRVLLDVPTGCPIPAMYWDCGDLTMENRIIKKKLMFLHHIANLPESALANQFYQVQRKMSLPGLYEECSEVMTQFDIFDLKKYSKVQFKKLIQNKVQMKNRKDLLNKIKTYRKLSHHELSLEKFERKSYFSDLNLNQARIKFRIRSKTLRTIKMNLSSDKIFAKQLWSCWHCPMIDSQTHVRVCPAYLHLREEINLEDDKDLVKYFTQVIKLRENML